MFHVKLTKGEFDMGHYIAIANQKGGVGKTTTVVNLASVLSLAGKKCLVIDLDPQGNATSGFGLEKKRRSGSHLLLSEPQKASETVRASRLKDLDIVPSSLSLSEAEMELGSMPDHHLRLKASRSFFERAYDFIFVDCPPSSGFFPLNALYACDDVLIPIQCEYYAMEGLTQILANIATVNAQYNHNLQVLGILLTMYDGSEYSNEVASEIRSHFPDIVFSTVVPRDTALAEAPSHGLTITDYDPRSRGTRSYIELAKEILNEQE